MGALILIGADAIEIIIIIISGIRVWPHHEALAHLSDAVRAQRSTFSTWANRAFIYSFTWTVKKKKRQIKKKVRNKL